MSRRRVVITGLGTINPVAHDVPTYWKALLAGKSGIGPITLIDSTAFKVHFAGEVKDFRPEAVINSKEVKR
ncbi:MAG TPA: beta-ketoacyl synthase N-terminal-like domain-containing protein, partial [Gemmataceae bacterium]|nr:beta-ketoacyl synthase N-terminal-like domain-containing protein [Gemmataceae bacterium]